MGKRVIVLSTSLRKHGNSDTLADAFAKGAKEAGHQVEKISLIGKKIGFCQGCLACLNTQRCVIHDDADAIVQAMKEADVLAFATPIYYYEMCGQMKTLLDRANPLFSSDYAFREVYLLTAAAEDGQHVWQRAASGLEGWVACFPKARFCGAVFGGNATEVGSIQKSDALQRAYTAGRSI